jgi:ABC-2 type transport system permease protein
MNPALLKLITLTFKARLRRIFRGCRTLRGAFLILFTIGVVVLFLGPSLATAIFLRGRPGYPQMAGLTEPYLPLIILGVTLLFVFTSAGEKALYFSPAEVDFLFPAPFHRRELLLFKLSKTLLGMVFVAFIFSILFLLYLTSWLAAFVGILLTLAFLQLLAMAAGFVGQLVAEHAYTVTRKLVLVSIGVLVAAGLIQLLWQSPVQSISELALGFRHTWPGMLLLAPVQVFSNAITARKWFPDLAGWAAGAAAIDLGLLALILKLDADYLESAAAISQKLYEKMQRVKQGGGIALPASKSAARIRLPMLPWLGGAGPLAWRQTLLALRTSQYAILMSAGIGAGLLVFASFTPRNPNMPNVVPLMGIGFLVYLTFIFALQLPWAFRGDIDHMDSLKSLPVRPLALATGELAGAVAVLTAIQLIMLAGLLGTGASAALVLVAAAFVVPFDVLMLVASNTLFLIYPVRIMPTSSADFQFFGRTMLFMLLQGLILLPSLGIPAAAGGLAYLLSGFSWPVFAATSWVVLVAELPVWLLLLARVFERFDPSTQTPA